MTDFDRGPTPQLVISLHSVDEVDFGVVSEAGSSDFEENIISEAGSSDFDENLISLNSSDSVIQVKNKTTTATTIQTSAN